MAKMAAINPWRNIRSDRNLGLDEEIMFMGVRFKDGSDEIRMRDGLRNGLGARLV